MDHGQAIEAAAMAATDVEQARREISALRRQGAHVAADQYKADWQREHGEMTVYRRSETD